MATTQECCEQYSTNPGGSTQQSSSCTATYHPSWKVTKLEKLDMRDTAGEVRTNSWVMYSCGPLNMDEQRQDDQLEPTYNSSVPIWNVALYSSWEMPYIQWGRKRLLQDSMNLQDKFNSSTIRVFANSPGDMVQSQIKSYQRLKKNGTWYLLA